MTMAATFDVFAGADLQAPARKILDGVLRYVIVEKHEQRIEEDRDEEQQDQDDELLRPTLSIIRDGLRLVVLMNGMVEALIELQIAEMQPGMDPELSNEILRLIRASSGINLDEEIPRNPLFLEMLQIAGIAPRPQPTGKLFKTAVAVSQMLLGVMPPSVLNVTAAAGFEVEIHEIQLLVDRVRSFIARNDPEADARLRPLGRAYAEGRLSLAELEEATGQSRQDVVVQLERMGYARSVEVILAAQGDPSDVLDRLRQDRLARAGQPVTTDETVRREVVASQRIEGVDARWCWNPRQESS